MTFLFANSVHAGQSDAAFLLRDGPEPQNCDHVLDGRSVASAADPPAVHGSRIPATLVGARVQATRVDTPAPSRASRQLVPRPLEPLSFRLIWPACVLPLQFTQPRTLACRLTPILCHSFSIHAFPYTYSSPPSTHQPSRALGCLYRRV
jgi:hypothetical protein